MIDKPCWCRVRFCPIGVKRLTFEAMTELGKELRSVDVFCLSSGAMLSSLFILPGLAYAMAGPAVLVSYFLAAMLALTGLFSQAELVSAMPKAGGTYFYVTRAMGSAVGTVYGLITWLSFSLKAAYELLFMGVFFGILVHLDVPKVFAVLTCLIFLAVNLRGAKSASRVQVYLVFSLLAMLIYFCFSAYPALDAHNFTSFAPRGIGSVLATAGFVFASFGGPLKVTSIAEEVKNPARALPLGMIFSLVVVTLSCLAVVFVAIAVRGPELAGSDRPISDVAEVFLGRLGWIGFALAAILAIVSAANTGIMAASRYPLALARDEMLPGFVGRINQRFKTPHHSIIITSAVIIGAIFVPVTALIKAASSVFILSYIFANLAVIILRESQVQNYQPHFRSPLYPWVQLGGLLGFVILLYGVGLTGLVTCSLLGVCGFLVYWFYGRKRASQEHALLHLIERITAKELTTHSLETELKDIIHERDEILKDRFDHLVEESPVLDIDHAITMEEFFQQAADVLAGELAVDSDMLVRKLLAREKESSTVLMPSLAVPHIIIEGAPTFKLLLARCRAGIIFSPAVKVHTVFVLIGTKDERPFHLLSLAAIAQIIQDDHFEQKWLAARNTNALRDILLLGKRKRAT